MTLIPKGRILITTLAILLVALCGACSGFLLGRIRTLHLTEARLGKNAAKLEGLLDSFLRESNSLLDTLNASQYPPCSSAEQAWMRQLIYHSTYLRDAGHMRNGTLECSADFDATSLPRASFKPVSSLWNEFNIYANLPPYASRKSTVFLMQKGNSYVVEDPGFEQEWEQIYKDSNIFLRSRPHQQWLRPDGSISPILGAVVNRDAQGIEGDTIYATRCSAVSKSCTLAYGSYAAELYSDRVQLTLSTTIGALSGVVLALAYLFYYQRRRSASQQLRRAIRRDQLRVVYQPIVELATLRIVEAEALLRWTDDSGYAVSPDIFVHTAETCGFVNELTALVVRRALRDFGKTLRANPAFRLNINVTATDLADPQFLPMLERSLAREAVDPQSLTIEVTESSTARRQEAIATIHQLRRRGHCVQIDDFGTGYSSLAYLKDLAVDAIKIDKSFTHAIGTQAVIGNILPQILAMAEALGLMVIAEGIETPEQAEYFAASTRPVLGQGWLFGRPMPAANLQTLLAANMEAAVPA